MRALHVSQGMTDPNFTTPSPARGGPAITDFLEDEDVLSQPDLAPEENEEEDAFLAEAERDSPPPPEATRLQRAAAPQPAAGPSDIKAKLTALPQKKREEVRLALHSIPHSCTPWLRIVISGRLMDAQGQCASSLAMHWGPGRPGRPLT